MSNKRLPKCPFPILIEMGYAPAIKAAPLRIILRGKFYDMPDLGKIPEEDFKILLGMAMGLQQTFDTEMLRRHPELMEERAALEASHDEWMRANGLTPPNQTPQI